MANDRKPWSIAGPLYLSYRAIIRSEREVLETMAAKRWRARDEKKQQRKEIFRRRLESSFPLFAKGLTVQEVAQTLDCSVRTAYRRMKRFRNKEDRSRKIE
jgi:CRP-like cAMP-binding protein